MYSFVPADEEARKLPSRESVLVTDEMVRSKRSLLGSGVNEENTGSNIKCEFCNKTYKNKNSLGSHKRKYHSKLPLRLFHKRNDEDSNESDDNSEDDSDSTMASHSRKRKISTDDDDDKKSISSYSEDSSDSNDAYSRRRSKVNQHSKAIISHPSKKRSISPDTERVIKKLKRKHKEGSVRRKIRKNLEKRRRNKRKRPRRKLVIPKYVEPANTDDEIDNVSDIYQPPENQNVDDTENPADDTTSDESDDTDPSEHVNCVTVEDFEKVRKAIKNYNADAVFDDLGLNVIQTLFKGILDGWIPICTSQKQMFSDNAVTFIRKARESKIIDLHSLIENNREELENIFNVVDKSIKLVVDSYNKFGIADDDGNPK